MLEYSVFNLFNLCMCKKFKFKSIRFHKYVQRSRKQGPIHSRTVSRATCVFFFFFAFVNSWEEIQSRFQRQEEHPSSNVNEMSPPTTKKKTFSLTRRFPDTMFHTQILKTKFAFFKRDRENQDTFLPVVGTGLI